MDPEPLEEFDDGLLDPDFVETNREVESLSKAFDLIKGYKIQTDLDR